MVDYSGNVGWGALKINSLGVMQPLNHWLHNTGFLVTGYDMDLQDGRDKTMGLLSLADTKRALDDICIGMCGGMGSQGNMADRDHQHKCNTSMAQGGQHPNILVHLLLRAN